MDAYQRLIDGLPTRLPPGRSQRVSEKAMREAVAGLPLANTALAAKEVNQLLDGMLATTWSGSERIAALAHLHAPVESVGRGIEQLLGGELYPLSPASAELAATAQRLEWKLACAAALGLHELCAPAGKLPMFKGKLAVGALVAGLVHASQALVWAYRQYQSPPAGTWRLLHGLYGFAEALGMADQVADNPQSGGVARSARALYAQALLLAMSNPYRFSTRELEDARAVMRCVAGQCGLTPASAAGVGVDTLADVGPGYVDADRIAVGPGVLAVDVEPVVRVFDERIALLPVGAEAVSLPCPGGSPLATNVGFLRHLQAGWATAAREHGRLAAAHVLDMVVGMHALHYALAGEVDFATFIRRVNSEAVAAGQHELPKAWPVTSDAAQPPSFRGEVVDQSEGGYRLRLQLNGSDGARLRIGEVIGLAPVVEANEEREWMVGVIRWLTHTDAAELLGVELLHRSARAAGLRPVTSKGDALVPQRAVELPNADGQDNLSLLVTNHFARDVEQAEVVLPALASDWHQRAAVGVWRFGGAEALGAACIRVTLVRDSATAEATA